METIIASIITAIVTLVIAFRNDIVSGKNKDIKFFEGEWACEWSDASKGSDINIKINSNNRVTGKGKFVFENNGDTPMIEFEIITGTVFENILILGYKKIGKYKGIGVIILNRVGLTKMQGKCNEYDDSHSKFSYSTTTWIKKHLG